MTIKTGMIGLDTSHCPAFVNLLNDPKNQFYVPGAQVVKAFPGGSKTFSNSHNRVGQFTEELKGKGIEIVDSIEALKGMDAFFLESVDGTQHLEQFKILAQFGKPVFIDKPLACSLSDAKEIAAIAKAKNIPVMTASAIRYANGISTLKDDDENVGSCDAFGPMALLDDYRDYFWYGIHSAEVLFSFMGKGCASVQAFSNAKFDVVLGTWSDGRLGTMRGNRFGGNNFGCTITTDKANKSSMALADVPYYAQMLKHIVPFFATGKAPIDFAESLEIIAFLEAASQSRAAGGKVIEITSIL